MQKQKEDYAITRTVNVDSKESMMNVKISFNAEKGTTAITQKITTKQLSFNEPQASAVLQQASNMLREGYEKALDLTRQWIEDNRPDNDNQLSIFDQLKEQAEEELEAA